MSPICVICETQNSITPRAFGACARACSILSALHRVDECSCFAGPFVQRLRVFCVCVCISFGRRIYCAQVYVQFDLECHLCRVIVIRLLLSRFVDIAAVAADVVVVGLHLFSFYLLHFSSRATEFVSVVTVFVCFVRNCSILGVAGTRLACPLASPSSSAHTLEIGMN